MILSRIIPPKSVKKDLFPKIIDVRKEARVFFGEILFSITSDTIEQEHFSSPTPKKRNERMIEMKPKVYITRRIQSEGLNVLEPFCDIELWEEDRPIPKTILLEKVKGIRGLISMLSDPIDEEVIANAKALKVVANFGVGYDNIDIACCTREKIRVGNTPGVLTDATADLAFALLLTLARRIEKGAQYVKEGRWLSYSPTLLIGKDLSEKTVGIIGFGRIGQAVAKRAKGFGMRVIYANPSRKPEIEDQIGAQCVFFNELLEDADFISLHCPLTPKTERLIGEKSFERMKKEAILVNTARGKVIDTEALIRALRTKRIAAAGLDVTDPEPLLQDHPLLKLDNCLVVPHIGSATTRTRGRVAEMSAKNILAGINGEALPYPVNMIG